MGDIKMEDVESPPEVVVPKVRKPRVKKTKPVVVDEEAQREINAARADAIPAIQVEKVEIFEPQIPVDTSDLGQGVECIEMGQPSAREDFIRPEVPGQEEPCAPPVREAVYEGGGDDPERRLILTKLVRYKESFIAFKAMVIDRGASTESLRSQLDEVRTVVSSRNLNVLVKTGYAVGTKALEITLCSAGAKVYGLSDVLSKSQEIDAILLELAIEMMPIQGMPAHHRLAFATLSTALALDSCNRKAEALQAHGKMPVSVEAAAAGQGL